MINKVNVQHSINIMRRARKVNMLHWQDVLGPGSVVRTEAELHECDTAACFAGHVAVSPEFQADGGKVLSDGAPSLDGWNGPDAIEFWLGIDYRTTWSLCALDDDENFYGKPVGQITAADVIEKLEELLNE